MASTTSCAQNGLKSNISQIDYLDTLCLKMSDECRVIPVNYEDYMAYEARKVYNEIKYHWFTEYLYLTYDTVRTPRINVSEKQLKEGKLRRIAEGKLRIEEREGYLGNLYNYPVEMNETEYFFLNNELVKISISKGSTDYNFMPERYWIAVWQLDLLCQKNKVVNRKAYYCFGDRGQPDNEWIERFVEYLNIDENALIEKAYIQRARSEAKKCVLL